MAVTGTQIAYYSLCQRKCWLVLHGVELEFESDLVAEGKLIGETTYSERSERFQQLQIEGIKVDFFDPKEQLVHEIKKSKKMEDSHRWQVLFYLYVLERNGLAGVKGVLEYPKLRKKTDVLLGDAERLRLAEMEAAIGLLKEEKVCPPVLNKRICQSCAFYEFCYSGE